MPDRAYEFEAAYDDANIDAAAKTYVEVLYKKYRGILGVACLINIIGFLLVLILPGSNTLMTIGIGCLAAIGPAYFPWAYFRFPSKFAANMKRGLKPTARLSVTSSSFSILAKGRSFTKQWADLKAILEFPDFFLIVVAPLAFTFIPKKDAPDEAQQLIREASRRLQPNPSIQADGKAAADLKR